MISRCMIRKHVISDLQENFMSHYSTDDNEMGDIISNYTDTEREIERGERERERERIRDRAEIK